MYLAREIPEHGDEIELWFSRHSLTYVSDHATHSIFHRIQQYIQPDLQKYIKINTTLKLVSAENHLLLKIFISKTKMFS